VITYSAFVKYLRKKMEMYWGRIYKLFRDFKESYNSVRRKVFYNILSLM